MDREEKLAYHRRYHQENREKQNAARRARRLLHLAEEKATASAYYQAHKRERNKAMADWEKKNPEKVKEYRRRTYRNNRKRILAGIAAWAKSNPEKRKKIRARYRQKKMAFLGYVMERRIRSRIFKKVKQAGLDARKASKTIDLLGCSFTELLAHIEARFTPEMTREQFMRGEIHLDHIKPCAAFDLSDPEQQKLCFHYTNLQPLWAADNLSKGAKWDSNPARNAA